MSPVEGCARLALDVFVVSNLTAPVAPKTLAAKLREHTEFCGRSVPTGGYVQLERKGGFWSDLAGERVDVSWSEIGEHLGPALTAERIANARTLCAAWGRTVREQWPHHDPTGKIARGLQLWKEEACLAAEAHHEPAQGVLL